MTLQSSTCRKDRDQTLKKGNELLNQKNLELKSSDRSQLLHTPCQYKIDNAIINMCEFPHSVARLNINKLNCDNSCKIQDNPSKFRLLELQFVSSLSCMSTEPLPIFFTLLFGTEVLHFMVLHHRTIVSAKALTVTSQCCAWDIICHYICCERDLKGY